ncbi:MAG: ATP-cone domain protein [Fluviicola sp.]|jgi:hypothetical protein|uniref:ATP cone domain-containing protein n=1 Tax=Fluviicola sp. TaxID=1917219 RepID=UPI00262B3FF1|nr:ATP cone domain-containing protein [Fluviicola sp.]MDF3026304.1 ATP-cone domain protein [Fluviicola sp.]
MNQNIHVTKASGEKSLFSAEKIRRSLSRSGASDEQIELILKQISSQLYNGITTKKIYQIAFSILKGSGRHTAARYHLKQAIMELGPSGFPFEKYFAELLKNQGYSTQIGQIIQGRCVTHEIDIIAKKNDQLTMVECKYHNHPGIFCNVKIPLYIHARFEDIKAYRQKTASKHNPAFQVLIATNTRFSIDAVKYAICSNLELLGWDYPVNHGLKDLIDQSGLYPITCLTSLTRSEKQQLLDLKIVLCKELLSHEKTLKSIGVKSKRLITVLEEADKLCQIPEQVPNNK